MLPTGICHFDFDGVNRAPASPGVYAWYAKLNAGAADWRRVVDSADNIDLGEKRLKELLLRHCRKFDPVAYDITATSHFELAWSGKLVPELAKSIDRALSEDRLDNFNDSKKRDEATKIQRPLKREKTRSLLVEFLKHATPFFAAPIYIGTSDDLRRRLGEHKSKILKLANHLSKEPEARDKLLAHIRKKPEDFAARVTAQGLSPEQLEVYTLDARALSKHKEIELSNEDLEALAAAAEWLLNRWHRPIAGKI